MPRSEAYFAVNSSLGTFLASDNLKKNKMFFSSEMWYLLGIKIVTAKFAACLLCMITMRPNDLDRDEANKWHEHKNEHYVITTNEMK